MLVYGNFLTAKWYRIVWVSVALWEELYCYDDNKRNQINYKLTMLIAIIISIINIPLQIFWPALGGHFLSWLYVPESQTQ